MEPRLSEGFDRLAVLPAGTRAIRDLTPAVASCRTPDDLVRPRRLLPGRIRTALVTYTGCMVEDRPGRSPHVLRWRAPVRRWLTTGLAIAGLLTVAIGIEAVLGQPGPNTPSHFSSLAAEAEAAREGGDLEKAVPLYRQALTVRPDWRGGGPSAPSSTTRARTRTPRGPFGACSIWMRTTARHT
jgi:hypothetical protein